MSIEVALSKLRSAQICHPNAVQFLIDEAITAIQQAEVTDADIDAVTIQKWGDQRGAPLQAHRAYARAILALHPVQSGLTGCNCRWDGDTQVQWCELHLAHKEAIHEWAERAKEAEKQLALHPAPGVPDDVARHIVGWWLCNEANPQDGSPWTTEPSQRVLDHMKVVSGEKHTVMRLVAIDAAILAAK